MSFFERLGNTIATFATQCIRDYYMMYKLEDVIDHHFPELPRDQRPSLKTLEKQTSLALQFGHPLIMDGLRPMVPNYVQVGMMNCRDSKPLPEPLKAFLDGADDEHGAIFVSFGSVLTGLD